MIFSVTTCTQDYYGTSRSLGYWQGELEDIPRIALHLANRALDGGLHFSPVEAQSCADIHPTAAEIRFTIAGSLEPLIVSDRLDYSFQKRVNHYLAKCDGDSYARYVAQTVIDGLSDEQKAALKDHLHEILP